MKKFLCLLVAVIFVGVTASAKSIDVNNMSLEELIALKTEVDNAINDHVGRFGQQLATGVYTVGVDIQSGKYIVHSDTSSSNGHLRIYESAEKMAAEDPLLDYFLTYDTVQDIFITLKDDEILDFYTVGISTIRKADLIG